MFRRIFAKAAHRNFDKKNTCLYSSTGTQIQSKSTCVPRIQRITIFSWHPNIHINRVLWHIYAVQCILNYFSTRFLVLQKSVLSIRPICTQLSLRLGVCAHSCCLHFIFQQSVSFHSRGKFSAVWIWSWNFVRANQMILFWFLYCMKMDLWFTTRIKTLCMYESHEDEDDSHICNLLAFHLFTFSATKCDRTDLISFWNIAKTKNTIHCYCQVKNTSRISTIQRRYSALSSHRRKTGIALFLYSERWVTHLNIIFVYDL